VQLRHASGVQAQLHLLVATVLDSACVHRPERDPVRMGVEVLPRVQQPAERGPRGLSVSLLHDRGHGELALLGNLALASLEIGVIEVVFGMKEQARPAVLAEVGPDHPRQVFRMQRFAQRVTRD